MASAAMFDATAIAPSRRLLAGLILSLSNFMVVLDLTVANVSVPHIAGNLGTTLDEGTWIITSYAVAEAIVVPLTGWLAMRFGTVRTFLFAMVGFGLFSLLCGMSVSLGMLVACRLGQGICGGPIMPMSQTLLVRVFPPEQRGMALGVWSMTLTLGPACGPILGGLISDHVSWHWIFLINVPIAAGCTFAGYLLLRSAETPTRKLPIDKVGLALMVFWIGCLQMVLDFGRERDWFGDPMIVVLAILGVIGFCIFVIWELTEEHPIVDLRVFRHRGFSASVATMALCFGAFFSGVVLVPQYLQATLGYTGTQSGLVTAAHALAALFVAQIAARLVMKVDARLLICIGVTWMGITNIIRAGWTSGTDFWTFYWTMFIQGFGIPLMMIPLTTMTMSTVDPEETASAAGLQNFVRSLAIAVATSLVLTIWGNSQRVARNELVSALRPDDAQRALAGNGFSPEQSLQVISNMVDKEAVTLAVDHTFYIAAGILIASGLLVWLSPKIRLAGAPPAGH